jgi:hypothetical protein
MGPRDSGKKNRTLLLHSSATHSGLRSHDLPGEKHYTGWMAKMQRRGPRSGGMARDARRTVSLATAVIVIEIFGKVVALGHVGPANV